MASDATRTRSRGAHARDRAHRLLHRAGARGFREDDAPDASIPAPARRGRAAGADRRDYVHAQGRVGDAPSHRRGAQEGSRAVAGGCGRADTKNSTVMPRLRSREAANSAGAWSRIRRGCTCRRSTASITGSRGACRSLRGSARQPRSWTTRARSMRRRRAGRSQCSTRMRRSRRACCGSRARSITNRDSSPALIEGMLGVRELWLPKLMRGASGSTLRAEIDRLLRQALETELKSVSDAISEIDWRPLFAACRAAAAAGAPESPATALAALSGLPPAKAESTAAWCALADLLLTAGKKPALRKQVDAKQGFLAASEGPAWPPLKRAMKAVLESLAAHDGSRAGARAAAAAAPAGAHRLPVGAHRCTFVRAAARGRGIAGAFRRTRQPRSSGSRRGGARRARL